MIYKKSFGQHFLKNDEICKSIVYLLFKNSLHKDTNNINLLEIGPGAGAITRFITQHNWKNFKAVEIDSHKIEYLLSNKILNCDQIIAQDFLKIDSPFSSEFKIIGNFPYNISTQIMFKIFEWYPNVLEVIGMFQKEVAERIASKEGNKNYGILSVLTQALYDTSIEIDIPPSEFTPPPKVDSAVIYLYSNHNKYDIKNFNKFTSFVKAAFAMRRKTLRNNWKGVLSPDILSDSFFNNRAEQLSVEQFITLYKTHLNDK